MQQQMELSDYLAQQYSRMSEGHSAATTDKTSSVSWTRLQDQQNREFLFLDLRTKKADQTSGSTQDVLSEIVGRQRGELWMDNSSVVRKGESVYVSLPTSTERKPERFCYLNIGESPIVPIESKLSWVLEAEVVESYSLSKKASMGILSRAQRRGKELPEILRKALEQIANK